MLSKFVDDIPRDRSRAPDRRDLRRRDVRRQPDHAAFDARAGPAPAARRRTARRSRSRTSRCSCSAVCSSTCSRERRSTLNVLGATSGDTGSLGRACDARQARRRRVHAVAAWTHEPVPAGADVLDRRSVDPQPRDRGSFDDCQDIVKAIASDAAFKRDYRHRRGQLDQLGARRRAGRLLLQRLFRGHARHAGQIASSSPCPSGNFGNILAGHVAREMGLPISRLILATNENDVLDEFFRTGRYRPRTTAQTHATSSPSMDISKASNFERFVFDIVGRDPERLPELWRTLVARRRIRPERDAVLGGGAGVGLRVAAGARTRTASRRFATSTRATASSSTRTRRTASRSGASCAIRTCR